MYNLDLLEAALAPGAPLAALTRYPQFILWKTIVRGDEEVKVPINPHSGVVNDAHDPAIHVTYTHALKRAREFGPEYGVGFVFTERDPFFFVDVDDCLQPDGTWRPDALAVVARFPGAAVEVSHSGEGLHIIATAPHPPEHSRKNIALGLELYTSKRFIALTGAGANGDAGTPLQDALAMFIADYFQPAVTDAGTEWTDAPVPEWNGYEQDEELIHRACRATSGAAAFGGRASFKDLWEADEEVLGRCYPDSEGSRSYDASSADAALAQHLAFWTGKNHERIRGLMQKSGLTRDKWDREDYLIRTVTKAVAMQTDVYTAGAKKPEAPPEPVEPTKTMGQDGARITEGFQYLAVTQQLEHFKGCVYVRDAHRVFTPDGALLKPDQFKAVYGGYEFAMDNTNTRTTRNAWEAFTESQAVRYPKAAGLFFRPDLPAGALVEFEGQQMINSYVPIETPSQPGDPGRFLDHMARLLPVERDRQILLAYMAACVQHRGVKFQWAPLIQGAEGNGKTLFTECVAAAVGRRYSHVPKAQDIDNKFNAWLANKLFIGVEDVYIPESKSLVIETLKPMITGHWQEIQAKGQDQLSTYVCANFILNSNHKDAIRKTRTDRRFAVFFTAQQEDGDLAEAGMTGDYFPSMYRWLRNEGGHAIVTHFLANYPIPEELNPAGACHRAPETSSTAEAIEASLGSIEQEILEAVDEERPGFAGGWVSSLALDRLLESLRATRCIPPRKRAPLLATLGYVQHPGLRGGRTNNVVPCDNGKPRLYVQRNNTLLLNLQGPAEIAKVYADAQVPAATTGTAAQVFAQR